jgi:hypothetical protein
LSYLINQHSIVYLSHLGGDRGERVGEKEEEMVEGKDRGREKGERKETQNFSIIRFNIQ